MSISGGMNDGLGPARNGSERPVLIRSSDRRAASGLSTADEVGRLASLAHELSGLLDGSLRSVNLLIRARRGPARVGEEDQDTQRRLESIRTALGEMTHLVQRTLGPTQRRFVLRLGGLTVGDAVIHGVAVLESAAAESGVKVETRIDERVSGVEAGPAYAVVVNGVRNAIESLRRSPRDERVVTVRAGVDLERGLVELVIGDNGPGLPPGRKVTGERRVMGPFDTGFTTKADGSGLGLPFCREVVTEAGGVIELTAGDGGNGAALRAEWPLGA